MNRRTFLASLFALPAAVKAVVTKPAWPLFQWQLGIDPGARLLKTQWIQTARTTSCISLAYGDRLDEIMEPDPIKRRIWWHERRRKLFKQNLARQLAMPAPKLP
jgi:hypothetical protein